MVDRPVGFFRENGQVKPRHTKNGVNETDFSNKEKNIGEKIEVKVNPWIKGDLNHLGAYFRYKNKPVEVVQIKEVIDRAEKRHSHFFDDDTMRFFKSRPSDEAYKYGDKIYFITSEKGPSNIRKWSTRYITEDGNIETLGTFQEHDSLLAARRAIRDFIEEN